MNVGVTITVGPNQWENSTHVDAGEWSEWSASARVEEVMRLIDEIVDGVGESEGE